MAKPPKVAAIIQARMGSSRLPGKVMMDICGKPMLWHIVQRLKEARTISRIIIATSGSRLDQPIVSFCRKNNIDLFRGSENDVLDRFIGAAGKFALDYIVRITSDAPLVDPQEIDRMVRIIKLNQADYVQAQPGITCVHEGFEVVSLSALKRIARAKDIQEYHRQHVTLYIKENPSQFKMSYFTPAKVFCRPGYRLSVDTPADFKFMQQVYKKLWDGKNIVRLERVIDFLAKNPQVRTINASVKQKPVRQTSSKIAFLIEGGRKLGFGHLMRTIGVARHLLELKALGCFYITHSTQISKRIKIEGLPCFVFPADTALTMPLAKVLNLLGQQDPDTLVIDIRHNCDCSGLIKRIKLAHPMLRIVLVNNVTCARLLADINIYPVPQVLIKGLSWQGYKGQVLAGLEYFPLREDLIRAQNTKKQLNTIAISMGGSDPQNITLDLMQALKNSKYKVKVFIGWGFKYKDKIKKLAGSYPRVFKVYDASGDYAKNLASCQVLISALGISVYEADSLKIACIVVGNYSHDYTTASKLEKLGLVRYLGYYRDIKHTLAERLHEALENSVYIKHKTDLDGRGIERLSRIIAK